MDRFCVCPWCDHGQTCCPTHAFKLRRPELVAAARTLYNKSPEGREKARQRKRRQRTREYYLARGEPVPVHAQIKTGPRPPPRRTSVTDTAPPNVTASAKMIPPVNERVPPDPAEPRRGEPQSEPPRLSRLERIACSFCGRLCGPYFRHGPKRQHEPVRMFRMGRTTRRRGSRGLVHPPLRRSDL
jgi:hypothetical protein